MSVYLIQDSVSKFIKIGYAKNAKLRLKNLQTSSPNELLLVAEIPGDLDTESRLHRRLSPHRFKGEWFHPHPDVFVAFREERSRLDDAELWALGLIAKWDILGDDQEAKDRLLAPVCEMYATVFGGRDAARQHIESVMDEWP